jgi:tetratricopeptide (TPR) repeat protein
VKAKYKASEMGEKNKQTNKFEMLMPIVPELAALSMINEGTEGEINLSLLPKVKNEYTYNNIFITGELPAICEIKSTWLNASRKVDLLKNGFKLTDLVEVTKDYLTKDLYGSNDFAIILNNVQRCFFNNKISYGFGLSGHKVASEEFEKSLSKLNLKDRLNKRLERAYKILSAASGRSDNTVEPTEFARLLLERNLKEDEKHLDSYVAMAFYLRISGYLNNENYDSNALKQSLSVLDKALSFDPTFIDAWASKAKSHYFSREYPLAQEILTQKILTYDKSKIRFGALSNIVQLLYLLNDPENAEAYAKLAIIKAKKKEDQSSIYNSQADYFANQKDYKKCILFYQKSLEVDNLQHWMHGNLSSCYSRNIQFDLAIKSAESAIAIKDYGMAHTHLAQAYLGKGNELARQKNYKDAEGMYSQSLLNFEHWETYLQLMSVSVRLQKMDRALDAAQKAIAIYEGSTEVIVGIIAKLFDQRSDEYSSFMEKVLTEVKSESRTSELMYYVSYSLGMKNLKKEATKWALKGLDLTTRIVKKRSPEAESLDEYVMLANYHLLALWLNNDMEQLEKANEVYNIVAKIDEANPKVKNLNRYIQDANEKIGRRPASVKKKYK